MNEKQLTSGEGIAALGYALSMTKTGEPKVGAGIQLGL
jgi:hypothetical protein